MRSPPRPRVRQRALAAIATLVVVAAVAAPTGAAASALASGPNVQTLEPVADSYIDQSVPATNYGSASSMDEGASPEQEVFLRFVVPAGTPPVTTATFRLYATDASVDGGTLFKVWDTTWSESAITWDNHPAISSSINHVGHVPLDGWVAVDVSSWVKGPGTYSFAATTSNSDPSIYVSKEGPAGEHPQLVVVSDDGIAPTAPTKLTAVARSSTRVDLAWAASNDDTTVTYTVLRGGASVGTTAATTFSDLSVGPTTTYSYAVTAQDSAGHVSTPSNTASVTTPVGPAAPVIGAAGDIACDPADDQYNGGNGVAAACRAKATSTILLNAGVTAVFALGDEQYEKGTLSAFQTSYDPSWGRLKAITKPVPGNHEYYTSGAAGYYQYFGAAAGNSATGYYSFDVGTWHVVALNSACEAVPCEGGSKQEQWLKADLAAHPTQCTLAFWHHPRFSSTYGVDGRSAAFWTDLYAAGVDVVLNGHAHEYERFALQTPGGAADTSRGIREFVVGTAGKDHHTNGTTRVNSEVRNVSTFGVLLLTLRPGAYDWKFVPEAGATFTDSGTTLCH